MDALGVLRREDDAIQEEVWKLVRDRLLLADSGLRVNQGVVGMLGRTQRRSDAEAIQNLVAQVPGVVAVHGQIDFVEGDGAAFPDREGYAIKSPESGTAPSLGIWGLWFQRVRSTQTGS
jgi:hypothetical protein